MKSLISNIFKLTILTLAIIGFMSIGGIDYLKTVFSHSGWFNKSQETLLEKANKIADFSNINKEEYEISKTANIMGYKAVVAEHNVSGQKFIVLDSDKETLLTKKDFENDNIDKKIEQINKKLKKQFIHLNNIKILRKSSMYVMNQKVPYGCLSKDAKGRNEIYPVNLLSRQNGS